MTVTTPPINRQPETAEDWKNLYYAMKAQKEALAAQVRAQSLKKGDEDGASWAQMKISAQQKANRLQQRRVETQRFVLRNLDRLGRRLSYEELQEALNSDPRAFQANTEILDELYPKD